jgi:hypothetical protein
MERIGIAASKMAKGNLLFYNLYVFLLVFLFSLLIFFIAGISIVLSLILIGYISNQMGPASFGKEAWLAVIRVCMISLTVVVSGVSLFAILRNIKIKKD